MKKVFFTAMFLTNCLAISFGRISPNVIIIIADDLGYADAGFTQALFMPESEHLPEVNTPHTDSLAHQGIIFSNGYVTGNVCSPTRAGLMIARYQQRVGIYTAGEGGRGMPVLKKDETGALERINPLIPAWLKNTSDSAPVYYCGAFGKWHLGLDEVYINDDLQKTAATGYSEGTSTSRRGKETYGIPTNGPLASSKEAQGSPWHAMNRGFDECYKFMDRGAHDYWNPNELYNNFCKTGNMDPLENPDGTKELSIKNWEKITALNPKRTPENYLTNILTKQACEFIRRNAGKSRPFFCYLAYNAPHSPPQTPYHMDQAGILEPLGKKDGRRYDTKNPDWFPDPLWFYEKYPKMEIPAYLNGNRDTDEVRRTRCITLSMVYWVDQGIGKIVKTLKDADVYDNTIIFFISDNGGASGMRASNKPLNGHKATNWEGGIRVPFFFSWPAYLNSLPKEKRGGRVIAAPVTSLDILPTMLEAAKIPIPEGNYAFEGKSLLPLICGQSDSLHEYLFWSDGPEGAVRRGQWKLYITASENKLFNLNEDISETTDLAGKHPELVGQLSARYKEWMIDVAKSEGKKPSF